MARGLPAFWSLVFGGPFALAGASIKVNDPSAYVHPDVGLPVLGFGLFIITLGFYIQFLAAPQPPNMREGEEVITTRNPSQRAALARTLIGFALLLGAGYQLYFTFVPYVYPTLLFVLGLYLFSTGLHTYWMNTLTTYYVTNQRLIKEYRFISLVKKEIPFEKVRGVQERKSIFETLVGLGNVRVASGGGGSLEIVIRNIYSTTKFADEIRNLI